MQSGMTHLLPDLLRTLCYRMTTLLNLQCWDEAAIDMVRAVNYAQPFLQSDSSPEPLAREWEAFLKALRALSSEKRMCMYTALGEQAEMVRKLVEG